MLKLCIGTLREDVGRPRAHPKIVLRRNVLRITFQLDSPYTRRFLENGWAPALGLRCSKLSFWNTPLGAVSTSNPFRCLDCLFANLLVSCFVGRPSTNWLMDLPNHLYRCACCPPPLVPFPTDPQKFHSLV